MSEENDFIKRARESLEDLGGRPRKEDLGIYYLQNKNCYIRKNPEGSYITLNRIMLRLDLKILGFSSRKGKGEAVSEIDQIMHEIHMQKSVSAAVQSGILSEGIHGIAGEQILVTQGPDKITPEKGEFPVITWLVDSLLGETQKVYFWSWLQGGVWGLYKDVHRSAQALFLIGPPDSGKSLLQHLIITKLLGSRFRDPFAWLAGSRFNDELFKAMHLPMGPKLVSGYVDQYKAAFAYLIEKVVGTELQIFQKKWDSSFLFAPHWMPSISLNREPHCLATLPEFTPDISDKLLVLDCRPIDFSELERRFGIKADPETLDSRIFGESAAAIAHLCDEFVVPAELQHPSYHVRGFVAPSIVDLRFLYSIQGEVFDTLRELFYNKALTKSELEISRALEDSGCRSMVSQFRRNTDLRSFLESMAQRFPKEIQHVTERQWKFDFTA